MAAEYVSIDRLQPGVFIELELPWHRHPFLFNKFKISDPDDIAVLRDIGLRSIKFDPTKSDVQPLPATDTPPPPRKTVSRAAPMADEKQKRIDRLKVRRERYQRCDRAFTRQVHSARSVISDLKARPQHAMGEAQTLVTDMAEVLSTDSELMVHLMNDKTAGETLYFHALNVAVLSMLLAKNLDLTQQEMEIIGLGALFHDVGKDRIPLSVLHKRGARTKAERDFFQQHPRYGVEIVRKIDGFPEDAITIIAQHHELVDGSGYPEGLRDRQISRFTKVMQIANAYDEHCNHYDIKKCKTPHAAMSFMMAYQREQFDPHMLQVFIKTLGVYPPGSVVRLSNDQIGIVIAVDRRDLLNPSVLVYDPAVPKSQALVVDLYAQPKVSIADELRPADLTPEVVAYLSPRTRVSYYFDGNTRKSANA